MVAIVQGQSFLGDVVAFFKDLDLVVPQGPPEAASNASTAGAGSARGGREGEAPVPGGGDSIGNYLFAAPKGWTRTNYPDGVAYVSPPYPNTGEKCQLTIFPMRASSGDLLRDAIGAFQGLFKSDPMTRSPYPNPNWPEQSGRRPVPPGAGERRRAQLEGAPLRPEQGRRYLLSAGALSRRPV